MKNLKFNLIIFLSALLMGCTEIIDIDLNDSNPHLIVEANISNLPGPYQVKLTRSVNFDETNTFPGVSGATVIISDDFSNIDTLTEISPGLYQTNFIQGFHHRTYYLYINDNGNIHTAESHINAYVTLDSISISFLNNPFNGSTNTLISPHFNDPVGIENYYKINQFVNNIPLSSITITDDKSFDGLTYNRPIFPANGGPSSGDTLMLQLLCIDKFVYDYYFGYTQLSGFGINQSAAPGNPKSNITGTNVLGYFNASSIDTLSIIIP